MNHLQKLLENYLEKELEIEIEGEMESCSMLDWEQILADHDRWKKGMDGMTEEQKEAYCTHSVSDYVTICEYFLADEAFEQKVDNNYWIPFAVLGMYNPHIHGYAEMNQGGMLLFDVETDAENPPVIHILDGEAQKIANEFYELILEDVNDND